MGGSGGNWERSSRSGGRGGGRGSDDRGSCGCRRQLNLIILGTHPAAYGVSVDVSAMTLVLGISHEHDL